jgi:hypothetical protein
MVRSLKRRVVALEEATGGDDGECPRSGWGGGDDDNHTYELTFIDPGVPDDREEFCEACGRQLVYIQTWGDEPRIPAGAARLPPTGRGGSQSGCRIPSRMEGANE